MNVTDPAGVMKGPFLSDLAGFRRNFSLSRA
jgi:hypothetical protein